MKTALKRRRSPSPALAGLLPRDPAAITSQPRWLREELYGEPLALPRVTDEVDPFRPASDWRADARVFAPDGVDRPHRTLVGLRPARVVAGRTLSSVTFASPAAVLTCARRKLRREVMHATGRAGGKVRRGKTSSPVRCSRVR